MSVTKLENGENWFAVSTRSRQERVATRFLDSVGINTFLPSVTEMRHWSDRKQSVSLPMFPGYLFVRIAERPELRVQVLKTPGVVNFVCHGSLPVPIPQKEIDDIRTVLSERVSCAPYPFLRIGERVRIVGGALDQVQGTLVGRGPDSKLVLSIELIQRSLAIELHDFRVEPVFEGSPHAA
jgi:transcription antitermination factor NusG